MPVSSAGQQLASILSPAFRKESFRVDRKRPFTFICGGDNNDGTLALRHQFLDHLHQRTLEILPVLAEKAFPHQLVERNLQRFEEFLASAADCVLIFVESPGSFAETGLFAALPKVIKKTFVVNTRGDPSRETSFLTLGPIKLIRKRSWFDEVFYLDHDEVTSKDAREIVETILKTLPRYEKALVFHPKPKFTDLDLRLQLASVQMIVSLLRAATAERVTSVLRGLRFHAVDVDSIEMLLSLLMSINALKRQDDLYFTERTGVVDTFEDDPLIHSAEFSVHEVRAQAYEWSTKHDSQVVVHLRERLGIGE